MMADQFAGLEESWGLQAIVGGGAFCSSSSMVSAVPNSCYGVMDLPVKDDHDNLLFNFPDLFETTSGLLSTDELECLYKPFYPVSGSSSISVPEEEVEEKSEEAEQKQTCSPLHHDQSAAISSSVTTYVPKYKRRKSQHKRVVLQVTAEDLSSDMWAWRKYGQKPIKGSPYPRSYYRCSTSKGCLARKQVEQSCTDPSLFIITYSAEHNHSQPTKKNALAGTIRHKFPNPKSPSTPTSRAAKVKDSTASSPASSSTTTAVLSPSTPLNILSFDNEYNPRNVKEEMIMEETNEVMIEGKDDNNNVIFSGIKLDDDFFSGLEDLDELISELSNGHCSTKMFPLS